MCGQIHRAGDICAVQPHGKNPMNVSPAQAAHRTVKQGKPYFKKLFEELGMEPLLHACIAQYRIRHGPILHFDAAEHIKSRILQKKSNKMSFFSVVET